MKRGVELSMNVIIIAAIVLVVLVILILLVTNAAQNTQRGTSCTSLETGVCQDLNGGTCADVIGQQGYVSIGRSCPNEGETCCYKPLGGSE